MPSATPIRTFMRSASRYLTEPHPFARNPVSTPAHRHYAPFFIKRAAATAGTMIPFYSVVLFWPIPVAALGRQIGI
ncbi:hypothetical protein BU16DRAFT_562346 [Lophium mytilinum]|uniref:Uncharacterized protein n=1 Tax=Lophium mytilinum TaxID=390894 RepID=A0A6A6QRD1_9PEZI|nr:hypothetical protein BU16DRAFT_562346 [Lophium mytilinum]